MSSSIRSISRRISPRLSWGSEGCSMSRAIHKEAGQQKQRLGLVSASPPKPRDERNPHAADGLCANLTVPDFSRVRVRSIEPAQQTIDIFTVDARQVGIVGAIAQEIQNLARAPDRRFARQHVAIGPIVLAAIGAR